MSLSGVDLGLTIKEGVGFGQMEENGEDNIDKVKCTT